MDDLESTTKSFQSELFLNLSKINNKEDVACLKEMCKNLQMKLA
jgi:hypothetical protein